MVMLQLLAPEPHFENHKFRKFLLSIFWVEQMSKLFGSSKMQELIPESDPIFDAHLGCQTLSNIKTHSSHSGWLDAHKLLIQHTHTHPKNCINGIST